MSYDSDDLPKKYQQAILKSKELAYQRMISENPAMRQQLANELRKERIQERIDNRDIALTENSRVAGFKLNFIHIELTYKKDTQARVYVMFNDKLSFDPSLRLVKGSEGDILDIQKNESFIDNKATKKNNKAIFKLHLVK